MNLFKEIKWFIQRGKRGYADCDCWDFHRHLTSIIVPGLRKLKKDSFGCPSEFFDKDYRKKNKEDECWRWEEKLEWMAKGFEAGQDIVDMKFNKWVKVNDGYKWEYDEKKCKQLTAMYDRGMALFRKYFLNLWD